MTPSVAAPGDTHPSEATENKDYYSVQGHSRSAILKLLKAHMRLPISDYANTNLHPI